MATGARSGLVVIDVDPARGGEESLARLQSLMGSLPRTLTARTGGGGLHLYYRHPGVELCNTAGRLPGVAEELPGVDLRGDGGYVVAAPSRHATTLPLTTASVGEGQQAMASRRSLSEVVVLAGRPKAPYTYGAGAGLVIASRTAAVAEALRCGGFKNTDLNPPG